MKKLIPAAKLTLTPDPERRPTESHARARAKALRAWRYGKRPDLVVTDASGLNLEPPAIDWDSLPRTGGASGTAKVRGRVVQLSLRGDAALDLACELAKAEGAREVTYAGTIEAALAEYIERRRPKG